MFEFILNIFKNLSGYYGIIPNELFFLLNLRKFLNNSNTKLEKRDFSLPQYPEYVYEYFFRSFFASYNGPSSVYTVFNRRIVGLYIPVRATEGNEKELELLLESISSVSKLKYLSVSNIISIPKTLTSLRRLKGLQLWASKKLVLPNDIIKLKSLKELHLSGNFFNPVSKSLISLINQNIAPKYIKRGVHNVDAITLGLLDAYLGSDLESFSNSEEYGLSYRLNKDGIVISMSIWGSTEFWTLSFIPPPIFSLQNLEKLDLPNNDIQFIPHKIKRLKHLKKLNLANNPIRYISNSLGSLNSLETLDLSCSELSELPDAIIRLKNLKFLNLTETDIHDSNAREKIAHLTRLENFYISPRVKDIEDHKKETFQGDEKWIVAFITIIPKNTTNVKELLTEIQILPQCEELYYMAGECGVLVKVKVPKIPELDALIESFKARGDVKCIKQVCIMLKHIK